MPLPRNTGRITHVCTLGKRFTFVSPSCLRSLLKTGCARAIDTRLYKHPTPVASPPHVERQYTVDTADCLTSDWVG